MKTLNEILTTKSASTDEAIQVFDQLEAVSIEFMLGRWKGFEIATNHPIDGLLEISNWYGKMFINSEEVHPLLHFNNNKTEIYAVNPLLIPLNLNLPKNKFIGTLMQIFRPILQTKKSKARLRMVEHRGKTTAAMIYDEKAIVDFFVKIDENRVLGYMDLKGDSKPYFWMMERDNESNYKISL